MILLTRDVAKFTKLSISIIWLPITGSMAGPHRNNIKPGWRSKCKMRLLRVLTRLWLNLVPSQRHMHRWIYLNAINAKTRIFSLILKLDSVSNAILIKSSITLLITAITTSFVRRAAYWTRQLLFVRKSIRPLMPVGALLKLLFGIRSFLVASSVRHQLHTMMHI
jgi:hypothetical protein